MLRDTSMAFSFGSHPAIAAFMVAFRFSNLIRRLFGEGAMSSGFIPHFESVRTRSPEESVAFFRDLFMSLTVFLGGVILLAEGVLWGILKWGHLSQDGSQIVFLTMLMLPGILFICQFGLSSALLQCDKKFFLSGFAPVAFNAVWIVAVLRLKGTEPAAAMSWLSGAVVVAFFMQWAMTAPHLFQFLRKERFKISLFSQEVRSLFKFVSLGMLGIAATQINSALDGVFAFFASMEGPAYLWYAIRLEQLPLAMFGIALSAALLPSLSRAFAEKNNTRAHQLLNFVLRRGFSLIFPCVIGIFVLGLASINLIYGRGEFSNEATYQTTLCLWGYGIGLLPAVLVLIFAPAFYAQKDYRTPMIGTILSVIANIALNAIFVFGMGLGAFSIALATSISAWFNAWFLGSRLAIKSGTILDGPLMGSWAKTALCSLVAGGGTLLLGHFLTGDLSLKMMSGVYPIVFTRNFLVQTMEFGVLSGAFALLFFSYAWMFNATDILELVGLRKQEIKKEEV
jgi:putative peptidoglycan lipid II flippase